MSVDCYFREPVTCHEGDRFRLLDDRTRIILAAAPCQNLKLGTYGRFKIPIDEETPLGDYRCYFNDEPLDNSSINVSYRLCKKRYASMHS